MNQPSHILLTGATGYVGGRLLPLLAADGWRVRCLARQPERLSSRVPDGVEVVPGDLFDAASLSAAMQGVEAAFYLVHSMGATGDFEKQDRAAAENFAAAARTAGVQLLKHDVAMKRMAFAAAILLRPNHANIASLRQRARKRPVGHRPAVAPRRRVSLRLVFRQECTHLRTQCGGVSGRFERADGETLHGATMPSDAL
jgi:NAD(P)-dependent dehydrogenase (short-subunit alcohol dehydrogenase family)